MIFSIHPQLMEARIAMPAQRQRFWDVEKAVATRKERSVDMLYSGSEGSSTRGSSTRGKPS